MDIEHFQGNPSWCFRFMRRRHLSIRARTTVAQRLPADYQERVAIFRTYCRDKIPRPATLASMYRPVKKSGMEDGYNTSIYTGLQYIPPQQPRCTPAV
ncbi:hypothetical protein D4764_06G0006540 [Takifugu flavidus]|uniref:HTH CENPB-type domain-containing protein n=1 Tax=Takifugu flavidus TaxID=433684 RepID=A0A5C6MV04_9TELE|nr:hypothetical protein D4764_06G0006540 [Takifugu flavidus]